MPFARARRPPLPQRARCGAVRSVRRRGSLAPPPAPRRLGPVRPCGPGQRVPCQTHGPLPRGCRISVGTLDFGGSSLACTGGEDGVRAAGWGRACGGTPRCAALAVEHSNACEARACCRGDSPVRNGRAIDMRRIQIPLTILIRNGSLRNSRSDPPGFRPAPRESEGRGRPVAAVPARSRQMSRSFGFLSRLLLHLVEKGEWERSCLHC